MTLHPKRRFADRARAYARYRPTYPSAVVGTLRRDRGLTPEHGVADVGSGTGLLSRLLLDSGNTVQGVEPHKAMRAEAVHLSGYSPSVIVAGAPRAQTVVGSDLIGTPQSLRLCPQRRTPACPA
jgi:hypothetical protein